MGWYPFKNIVEGFQRGVEKLPWNNDPRDRDASEPRPTWGGTYYPGDPFSPTANPAEQERQRKRGEIAQYGTDYRTDRSGQTYALGELQNLVEGNGPSVAELQRREGQQQATALGLATLAQNRGGNMAATAMQGGAQSTAAAMQGNQDAAMLRANEQLGALQQYGQLSSTMAGQSQQGQFGYEQVLSEQERALLEDAAERRRQQENERGGASGRFWGGARTVAGGLGSLIGGMFLSDERAKDDVREVSMAPALRRAVDPVVDEGARREALAALSPIAFRYKEGMGEPGPQLGVSAQDLAETPGGQAMLVRRPDGLLGVNSSVASGTALAATAEHQREIDKLQKRLRQLEGAPEEEPANEGLAGALGRIFAA